MMRFVNIAVAVLALVAAEKALASHVRETIALDKGWNAVYLESTPAGDQNLCENFFSGELAPVLRVGAYVPDAYGNTEQYDSEGNLRGQQPVSYYVWTREPDEASTFQTLSGGCCYLIYAVEACKKTFFGTPCQPNLVWRTSSATNGYMNLVAPSLPTGTTVAVGAYFGEGPSGTSPTVCRISGQDETAPQLLPFGIVSKPKLSSGRAYAVTATRADSWPGVIQVGGLSEGMISFGKDEEKASCVLSNRGTTNHTFRLTVRQSEDDRDRQLELSRYVKESAFDDGSWSNISYGVSWEVTIPGGESKVLTFGLDRTNVKYATVTYGALLEIADLSGTKMRVRVPMEAKPRENASEGSPDTGLWVGGVALTEVSSLRSETPLPATGTMKLTALVHVDQDGHPTLLPRVTLATWAETNLVGTTLHYELDDVSADAVSRRRLTGLLLPSSVRPIKNDKKIWGTNVEFKYVIDALAKDNPFRHAWHPDHDGVDALYSGPKADGSETWALTNTLTFAWKDADGTPFYPKDPDGLSAGVVTWVVEGLAKDKLVARGMFSFKKTVGAKKVEGSW